MIDMNLTWHDMNLGEFSHPKCFVTFSRSVLSSPTFKNCLGPQSGGGQAGKEKETWCNCQSGKWRQRCRYQPNISLCATISEKQRNLAFRSMETWWANIRELMRGKMTIMCYQGLPWTGRLRAPPSNLHQVHIGPHFQMFSLKLYIYRSDACKDIFIYVMTCSCSKFNSGPDAKTAERQTWLLSCI